MDEQIIKKGLLIAGGLIGLGLLGHLLFKKEEETTEEAEFTIMEDAKPDGTVQIAKTRKEAPVVKKKPIVPEQRERKAEVPSEPNDDFPLKRGSKGVRVRQLRAYLLKNHGTAGAITDAFDMYVEQRVSRFLKVKEVSERLFERLDMANRKKQGKDVRKKKH